MTVTFFGHRTIPNEVRPLLKKTLIDLIEQHGADTFLVGNQGEFDALVAHTLQELSHQYTHIKTTVVLAYMPVKNVICRFPTVYPDGLENTPKRFSIPARNRWLIDNSDTIVTYVKHTFGGAYQFKELAEKKNKCVINLTE